MRDFEVTPYTACEKRVSDYIQKITAGSIGSGDDPIGFLMASHAGLLRQIKIIPVEGANQQRPKVTSDYSAQPSAEPDGQTTEEPGSTWSRLSELHRVSL